VLCRIGWVPGPTPRAVPVYRKQRSRRRDAIQRKGPNRPSSYRVTLRWWLVLFVPVASLLLGGALLARHCGFMCEERSWEKLVLEAIAIGVSVPLALVLSWLIRR